MLRVRYYRGGSTAGVDVGILCSLGSFDHNPYEPLHWASTSAVHNNSPAPEGLLHHDLIDHRDKLSQLLLTMFMKEGIKSGVFCK